MKKVLLIEDDMNMRDLLKTFLELEGYLVLIMEDVPQEEIQKSISANNPDYLILDVRLPHANGIEILSHLRADNGHQSLKIIMSSGMDYREQCQQAGADGYLLKPYMPDELLKILDSFGP